MQRKFLVTGATGFLGRYLIQRINANDEFAVGTSTNNFDENFVRCDITDERLTRSVIEAIQPDVVIHCAAISSVTAGRPRDYYQTNVIGTENVLKSLVNSSGKKIRFIFISTAGVYGNQDTDCLSEDLCPKPVHHYGMSKFCAERLMYNYVDFVDFTIVRPFNIIGCGQNEDFVVPKLAQAFRARTPSVQLGNIDVSRDYMDVEVACGCIAQLADTEKSIGEVVNLCTGQATSLRELIDIFESETGHSITVEKNANLVRANEVWRLIGNNGKLSSLLECDVPKTDIRSVLRSMLL